MITIGVEPVGEAYAEADAFFEQSWCAGKRSSTAPASSCSPRNYYDRASVP